MSSFVYSFAIWLYKVAFLLASNWSIKANARIEGLQKEFAAPEQLASSSNRILVHCASHGEYEQVRPVIDWIIEHTSFDITVSFFSSSGFNNVKLTNPRISKKYLPFDLRKDMRRFIAQVQPRLVIITKNEWWWNMLVVSKQLELPTYQISVTVRPSHYFIRYPFQFFRSAMKVLNKICVVNESSAKELRRVYDGPIIVAGDTRADQVRQLKPQKKNSSDTPTIIYGSVWSTDLPMISATISALPHYRHFIYPHELTEENIKRISSQLESEVEVVNSVLAEEQHGVYIVASMGQLKYDYHLATLTYVGGGFGDGIHNVLEAVVNCRPCIIGPKFEKSEEAKDLIEKKLLFSVSDSNDVSSLIDKLVQEQESRRINEGLTRYFDAETSATEIVCREIFQSL